MTITGNNIEQKRERLQYLRETIELEHNLGLMGSSEFLELGREFEKLFEEVTAMEKNNGKNKYKRGFNRPRLIRVSDRTNDAYKGVLMGPLELDEAIHDLFMELSGVSSDNKKD